MERVGTDQTLMLFRPTKHGLWKLPVRLVLSFIMVRGNYLNDAFVLSSPVGLLLEGSTFCIEWREIKGHCFSQKTWWNEWRSMVNSLWTTTSATGKDIMRRDIVTHLLVGSPGYVLQKLCAVRVSTALWLNPQGSGASSGEQRGRTPEGIAVGHRVADTADVACLWQEIKDHWNPKPVFLLSWDFWFMAIKIKVKLTPGSVGLFWLFYSFFFLVSGLKK